MDEVEEREHTIPNPHEAADAAGSPDDLDDATLAALLRQTARLRAIELQLSAVFDLRGHTEAMRLVTPSDQAATDCA
jgi:hypothetical protein